MGEVLLVELLRPLAAWAQDGLGSQSVLALALPVFLLLLFVGFRPRRQLEPAAQAPPLPSEAAEAAAPPVEVVPELPAPPEPELAEVEAPPELAAPTPELAPEAGEVAPEAGEVAPEAGEVAPEAVEVAPEAVEVAPEVPEVAPPPPKPRVPLRERLARTSEALVGRLGGLLGGGRVDAAAMDELEAVLFTADLGVRTAEELLEKVRAEASGGDEAQLRKVLHDAMAEKLRAVQPATPGIEVRAHPHVILVLGVNGSGKTTTIGKLAARYQEAGHSVLLGAGDTFRAAAAEQLQTWGERVGCEVIAGPEGGDPASVAFDTVKAAVARDVDVAIIDTAGRLQTKIPLMEELTKIARVIGKDLPEAPHETLLVLDANTGQNAISQARQFTEAATVTGLVLTKLDGTAKGGVIVGLADEFGIPVRYVGVGEGVEDLRDFAADEFVDALFAQ